MQKKYKASYAKSHYSSICARVPVAEANRIKAYAKVYKMSLARYIVASCDYYHTAHTKPHTETEVEPRPDDI